MNVFVYGTLKQGFPLHNRLGGANFIGPAFTKERFPLWIGDLPYLLDFQGEGKNVWGEVYACNTDQIATLDQVESHPVLYRRREIPVIYSFVVEANGHQKISGPHELYAWTYFYQYQPEGDATLVNEFLLTHEIPPSSFV